MDLRVGQPRCPSADEWIRKLWYIYTMEYYSAIKNTAAMNIGVLVSLSLLVFSVCMPSSGIAGSYLFWDPEFPNEFSISLSNSVKKPVVRTPWTAAYQAPPPMGFSRQQG